MDAPAPEQLGSVHLIGIGGVGMSGIARLLLARGVPVSGSDARDSAGLAALRELGAVVHVGHDAGHVAGAQTVVVSSAVRETNPELAEARRRGLLVLHRSQALASLMAGRRAVAIAGTHGKTTTTGMLTVALRHCGLDPSYAIGGDLTLEGGNAHDGTGDVFVAEADESDGSFLRYRPRVALITNVEPDHLDHYGTADAVREAFEAFCRRVEPGGTLVVCADDPGVAEVLAHVGPALAAAGVQVRRYGEGVPGLPAPDVRVSDVRAVAAAGGTAFTLAADGVPAGEVRLQVPGRHNALNAAAAWAAAVALGAEPDAVRAGLAAFGGTRRRFEPRGEAAGVRLFDDYAHHPTEVCAVLRAARAVAGPGRVVAVFQPHLFSRTRIFAADFGRALALADEVVVLDVYAAREDPEPGVSGQLVASAVPLPPQRVVFCPRREQVPDEVAGRARPGDVVLTIGAGDVTALPPAILTAIGERAGGAATQSQGLPG